MRQDLVPALQLADKPSLQAAALHMEKAGYLSEILEVGKLPPEMKQEWMNLDLGGYLFFLEEERFEEAMRELGRFFACTKPPKNDSVT